MKDAFKPLRGIFIIFFVVAAVVAISALLQPREIIPWRESFTQAQSESETTGKPIFAYFTASWCGPCRSMRRTTWADQQVEDALQDYVPVKIDVDRNQELAAQYRVHGIPAFFVLNERGDVVHELPGGYLDSQLFLELLTR